ncbi:helix-turn-helix domain-containing protein [Paenibacillus cymbidii]|uniref:helix-turn-helix domain-containing protein n=1 Tax=Paenibacillus cymbidii TaxID=1639034 RepID=UPI001436A478|nr:helix-turn-helix domain-containing protein [Paenibacillus cymbidii]
MFSYRNFKRAALLYIVLFLAIIVSIAALYYWNSLHQLKQTLQETNLSLLRQVDQKMDLLLRDISKSTVQFGETPEVARFVGGQYADSAERYETVESVQNKMKALMYANKNMFSMYLYSQAGRTIMTDGTLYAEDQFFDVQWLETFRDKNEYSMLLSTRKVPFNSGIDKDYKNMITFIRTYPLLSTASTRTGAILVNMEENTLYQYLTNDMRERVGSSFVINSAGKILMHSDKSLLNRPLDDAGYPAQLSGLAGSGFLERKVNGVNSYLFYQDAEQADWKYVRVVPIANFYEPFQSIRRILLIVATAMFLLSIGAVVVLTNWTFKPVDRFLREMSSRIKPHPTPAGDRMELPQTGEIRLGQLEAAFRQMIDNQDDMEQQIRDSKLAVKWRYVMEIVLSHRFDYEQEKPYMQMLGIELYPRNYIAMTIEVDPISLQASPKDIQLYLYAVANMAEELINAEHKGVAVQLTQDSCICIVSFDDDDERKNQIMAVAVAEIIKSNAERFFQLTVTIGIGKQYVSLGGVHRSYADSLEALKFRMIMGSGAVISYEDIQETRNDDLKLVFADVEAILESVQSGDRTRLANAFDTIFPPYSHKNVSPDMFKQMCLYILFKAIEIVSAAGVEWTQSFAADENVYARLSQCRDAADMKRYLQEALGKLSDRMAERKSPRTKNDLIGNIQTYIDEHYSESDLSLNMLADTFRISVPYLSKLFKEQVGSNFVTYLFTLRMRKAQAMLQSSKATVGEIAEAVGYHNTYSFIRMFKKHTGNTPGEYRNRELGDKY